MKRILILSSLLVCMIICNQAISQEKIKVKDDKTKVKDGTYKEKHKDNMIKIKDENGKMKIKGDGVNSNPTYPYTAAYSSNFAIGNPAHAKMVLDLWKDWEDNAFDRHDYFADTLVMYLPNGMVVKGKAANLEGAKNYRSSMSSSKATIDAWMPLRSIDKNEDWVAVWGTETNTFPDGKIEKKDVHEIWRINKDGKIDFMKQFVATTAPQQ